MGFCIRAPLLEFEQNVFGWGGGTHPTPSPGACSGSSLFAAGVGTGSLKRPCPRNRSHAEVDLRARTQLVLVRKTPAQERLTVLDTVEAKVDMLVSEWQPDSQKDRLPPCFLCCFKPVLLTVAWCFLRHFESG